MIMPRHRTIQIFIFVTEEMETKINLASSDNFCCVWVFVVVVVVVVVSCFFVVVGGGGGGGVFVVVLFCFGGWTQSTCFSGGDELCMPGACYQHCKRVCTES